MGIVSRRRTHLTDLYVSWALSSRNREEIVGKDQRLYLISRNSSASTPKEIGLVGSAVEGRILGDGGLAVGTSCNSLGELWDCEGWDYQYVYDGGVRRMPIHDMFQIVDLRVVSHAELLRRHLQEALENRRPQRWQRFDGRRDDTDGPRANSKRGELGEEQARRAALAASRDARDERGNQGGEARAALAALRSRRCGDGSVGRNTRMIPHEGGVVAVGMWERGCRGRRRDAECRGAGSRTAQRHGLGSRQGWLLGVGRDREVGRGIICKQSQSPAYTMSGIERSGGDGLAGRKHVAREVPKKPQQGPWFKRFYSPN
ncbi:hypothetical protein C8J57DRAFT_1605411 [Mycena rebaudengoi]|nr:hypothetical protein C8J57DRAFT_1605411 [Mycena rebaudengoi]